MSLVGTGQGFARDDTVAKQKRQTQAPNHDAHQGSGRCTFQVGAETGTKHTSLVLKDKAVVRSARGANGAVVVVPLDTVTHRVVTTQACAGVRAFVKWIQH